MDSTDKIVKHPFEELEDTKTKLLKANDIMVMLELQGMLKRQEEQAIVIGQLRDTIKTLSVGHVATINELALLRNSVDVLERHLQDVRTRQEQIASLCDHLAESLSHLTEP